MKTQLGIFLFLCFLVLGFSCQENKAKHSFPLVPSLAKAIEEQGADPEDIYIYISKSNYELKVMVGDITLKSYDVVFGSNHTDDKRMQGDGCMPLLCTILRGSARLGWGYDEG